MHSMNNLKRLPQLGRLAPESTAKFWQYDQAALGDGTIPKKYKELMARVRRQLLGVKGNWGHIFNF